MRWKSEFYYFVLIAIAIALCSCSRSGEGVSIPSLSSSSSAETIHYVKNEVVLNSDQNYFSNKDFYSMSCYWYWWAECTIKKEDATTHCVLKLGYPFFPYDTDIPYDSLSILPVQVKADSDTVWNSSIAYLGEFYDSSYFSKSPIYDFGDSSVIVHGYYSAGAWVDKDTTLSPINLILNPDSSNVFSLKMRDGVGNSDSLHVDLDAFLAPLILISGDSISFQITRLFSASYTTLQPDCSFSRSEIQKNAFQDSSVVLNIDIDFDAVKHCSDSSRVRVATIAADIIELSAIQIYME